MARLDRKVILLRCGTANAGIQIGIPGVWSMCIVLSHRVLFLILVMHGGQEAPEARACMALTSQVSASERTSQGM